MLPYKLRPPVYGGKLKKKKKAAAADADASASGKADSFTDHSFADGGPVECAIKSDLLELCRVLLGTFSDSGRCSKDDDSDLPRNGVGIGAVEQLGDHDVEGEHFRKFKKLFREWKYAMLHSRTVPPKVDRNAYSQVLYSACLSLMEDAFVIGDPKDDAHPPLMSPPPDVGDLCSASFRQSANAGEQCNVPLAALAIFALYALYSTNPLPTVLPPSSSSDAEALEFLSLGVQAPGNPKLLYRRAFKDLIRIDRDQFSLLQRVRDLCLCQMAECDARRAEIWKRQAHQIGEKTVGCEEAACGVEKCAGTQKKGIHTSHGKAWNCTCGIASDAITIIGKLHDNFDFDLCEYGGPCGVEGLAGSSDYHRRVVLGQTPRTYCMPSDCIITDEDLDGFGTVDIAPELGLDELKAAFADYQSSLDSVVVPSGGREAGGGDGNRQATLIRDALEQLLDRNHAHSKANGRGHTLSTLSQICETSENGVVDLPTRIVIGDQSSQLKAAGSKTGVEHGGQPAPVGTTARILSRKFGSARETATTASFVPDEESYLKENLNELPRMTSARSNGGGMIPEAGLVEGGTLNGQPVPPESCMEQKINKLSCYKVHMPTTFSTTLRDGIYTALEDFLKGGATAFGGLAGSLKGDVVGGLAAPSVTEQVGETTDERSSVDLQEKTFPVNDSDLLAATESKHELSSVKSHDTSHGRAALDTLLFSAMAGDHTACKTSKGKDSHSLLHIESDASFDVSSEEASEEDSSSLASMSSSEDDLSMAASGIGRSALHTLLSKVANAERNSASHSAKKRKGTTPTHGIEGRVLPTTASEEQTLINNKFLAFDLNDASSIGAGVAALDTLLGKVDQVRSTKQKITRSTKKQQYKPRSPQYMQESKKKTGMHKRKTLPIEENPCEQNISDDDMSLLVSKNESGQSVASSIGAGRAALSVLLGQVDSASAKRDEGTNSPKKKYLKSKKPVSQLPAQQQKRPVLPTTAENCSGTPSEHQRDKTSKKVRKPSPLEKVQNKRHESIMPEPCEQDSSTCSVSSAGGGKAALRVLLKEATNSGKSRVARPLQCSKKAKTGAVTTGKRNSGDAKKKVYCRDHPTSSECADEIEKGLPASASRGNLAHAEKTKKSRTSRTSLTKTTPGIRNGSSSRPKRATNVNHSSKTDCDASGDDNASIASLSTATGDGRKALKRLLSEARSK